MNTARVVQPSGPSTRPPVVLVHGAANSADVWRYWQQTLAELGWSSYALDLRGHGDDPLLSLAAVSMEDYAQDIIELTRTLSEPPVLLGWSMGGLAALMAAQRGVGRACVVLAPSTPATAPDAAVMPQPREYGPEAYGIASRDPQEQPAMPDLDLEERMLALASQGPESGYARDERRRGVVVQKLPCPLLLVTGGRDQQWPAARYASLSLPADRMEAPEASHWGLVLNRRVLATLVPQVCSWLEAQLGPEKR